MPNGLYIMSRVEIDRISVIKQVQEKQIKQKTGAKLLEISNRQLRRLLRSYKEKGADGIISKKRGKQSNHRHSDVTKEKIKKIIGESYSDFGPTFASEKLASCHDTLINKETVRQWMIEWGFWQTTRQKKVKIHQNHV